MALVSIIESLLPGWMNRPARRHWPRFAGTLALGLDAIAEATFQGRLAAMPGQTAAVPAMGGFESEDALPLIGRDRRIARGLEETSPSYARRLRRWRQSWRRAATGWAIAEQVQGVFGPERPTVKVVSATVDAETGPRPNVWHSIDPDGVLTYYGGDGGFVIEPDGTMSAFADPCAPWDWDSASLPDGSAGQADGWRIWVIVHAPTAMISATEGVWGPGPTWWGDGGTWGTTATPPAVELVRGVVADWKPAGIRCPFIIIAFDAASFDPIAPSPYTGLPDGRWGWNHKTVDLGGGLLCAVPSRLDTARYWAGPPWPASPLVIPS